jgi:hypothetical protein
MHVCTLRLVGCLFFNKAFANSESLTQNSKLKITHACAEVLGFSALSVEYIA